MIWLACKSHAASLEPQGLDCSYVALHLREQDCTFAVLSPLGAAFFPPPPPPALLLCIFENRSHTKTHDRGLVQPDLQLVDCSISQPLRYDPPSLQDLCTATEQGGGLAVSRRSKVTIETGRTFAHAYKSSCSFVYKVMVRHGFSSGVCDVALPAAAEWSQEHPRAGR